LPDFKTSPAARGKKAIKELLIADDRSAIRPWLIEARNPARLLTSYLFDDELLVRWRAAEALGLVAAHMAGSNNESVRRLLRRFFWMLNDESGNFCSMAPLAIGEILRNVSILIEEFAQLLPPFLVEEPFEAGTRLAISRIAEVRRDVFSGPTVKKLVQTLRDPDPAIRGTSLKALKALGVAIPSDKLKKLMGDDAVVEIYDFATGSMRLTTVAHLAETLYG